MNTQVISQIWDYAEPILEKISDRKTREFRLGDIEITPKALYLNNSPLKGAALSKILSLLRVKKNFIEFQTKMTPEDWKQVSSKIKNADKDITLFATIDETVIGGNGNVIDVHLHRQDKKHTDDATLREHFMWIEKSLSESDRDYSLKRIDYNNSNEMFELVLLDNSQEIDVFGTNLDMWKTGNRFYFNGLRFNHAPFFERLVCSNGNTAMQYGFKADISQSSFNNNKIQKTIEKALVHGGENIPELLQQSVQHLQNNNVSIAEFYAYRDFFNRRNENEVYNKVLHTYFNDTPFYKAYGENIEDKSRKWKSTANTGINAYNFFNMLTWIASHPEDVKMSSIDRMDLQIQASNLLFKKELDLEDIATGVKIDYPILAQMN